MALNFILCFVLHKQDFQESIILCFNWKKSAAEADRMTAEMYVDTGPKKSVRK